MVDVIREYSKDEVPNWLEVRCSGRRGKQLRATFGLWQFAESSEYRDLDQLLKSLVKRSRIHEIKRRLGGDFGHFDTIVVRKVQVPGKPIRPAKVAARE